MQKKSQIQIGETVAVLFVFFMIIVVGLIFYFKVIKSNVKIEQEELYQLRSVSIAQRLMFLPEVQCSENNLIIGNCVDILKLEAAQDIMKRNKLYYYDLLEFSEINITQIYPDEVKWTIYSRKIGNFTNRFVTNAPIALYDPGTRRHGFGILTIETSFK